MVSLILSSCILVIIPIFLSIALHRKIKLSYKFLSLGIVLSILSIIKFPILFTTSGGPIIKTIILSTLVYALAESAIRIYIHRKLSHQTYENIISIALGYISIKNAGIFLFQFFNFTQLSVVATQEPELLQELTRTSSEGILYFGQIFHSVYIFLYALMLISFIIISHKNIHRFWKFELLFVAINFWVILGNTTINKLANNPATINLYLYFNIFLIFFFATTVAYTYGYIRNVKTETTPTNK